MKTVVVHRGARDSYQVALALAERDALAALVTDLYWPSDRPWTGRVGKLLGRGAEGRPPRQRAQPAVPSGRGRTRAFSGSISLALDKWRSAPFSWRRAATRWTDGELGRAAGRLASSQGAALLAYSYYAHAAFSRAARSTPRILFQLHPHPVSVRRILSRELAEWPECAASLAKEWELALPPKDFEKLAEETQMADCWIVASSFSRRTLVENGIGSARIHVAPYGVDLERFHPAPGERAVSGGKPLRLLFVGTINQRKGVRYLIEALRLLGDRPVELVVCGRAVDDLSLFRSLGGRVRVRPSVGNAQLVAEYQSADLFVFPSLAEGFGHVLLEAMACGVPVLSTTHTALPDLITGGKEGFIVEPRRPDQLRERIEWALGHRAELSRMGELARRKAETFTCKRFRGQVAAIVEDHLESHRRASRTRAKVAHV